MTLLVWMTTASHRCLRISPLKTLAGQSRCAMAVGGDPRSHANPIQGRRAKALPPMHLGFCTIQTRVGPSRGCRKKEKITPAPHPSRATLQNQQHRESLRLQSIAVGRNPHKRSWHAPRSIPRGRNLRLEQLILVTSRRKHSRTYTTFCCNR